jgi:hypothetical protein
VFQLSFPNDVWDLKLNTKGKWTMVYDEGFEVRFDDEVYFAFSKYEHKNEIVPTLFRRTPKTTTTNRPKATCPRATKPSKDGTSETANTVVSSGKNGKN